MSTSSQRIVVDDPAPYATCHTSRGRPHRSGAPTGPPDRGRMGGAAAGLCLEADPAPGRERGTLKAEYLHARVPAWDRKEETARHWHLNPGRGNCRQLLMADKPDGNRPAVLGSELLQVDGRGDAQPAGRAPLGPRNMVWGAHQCRTGIPASVPVLKEAPLAEEHREQDASRVAALRDVSSSSQAPADHQPTCRAASIRVITFRRPPLASHSPGVDPQRRRSVGPSHASA